MSAVVGHRLARRAGSPRATPSSPGPPPVLPEPRRVAAGGPVDGTTWTVTVEWRQFADGPELVAGIRPFRDRERGGGGFGAPVPDPRTPVHIGTGCTDDLPPWVLVRTDPEVVSVAGYGRSGRRYDLGLTDVDPELGVRFGAVVLAAGDLPGPLVARLDDGRSIVECGPWWPAHAVGTDDPAPAVAPRDVYRRALAAAGAPAAGPSEEVAALRALARGARGPRERAAEVLCACLRGPVDHADPAGLAVRRTVQRILTTWVGAAATRLDLVGADLVDLDLAGCRVDDGDFSAADLHGVTRLEGTRFSGHARFCAATFRGDVDSGGARIGGAAEFGRATFAARACFDRVTVDGDAVLSDAAFRSDVTLVGAAVGGRTSLDHVLVRGVVDATGVRFGDGVDLDETDVAGHVLFPGATFAGPVELGTARVRGQVVLDGARASAPDGAPRRWPAGWALATAADPDGYRRLC